MARTPSVRKQIAVWSAKLNLMEYRGIRYTLRVGIERGQWFVAVYPQGVETKANKVFGTREWAELEARRMIERRLDGKSRQRARPEAVARRKFE